MAVAAKKEQEELQIVGELEPGSRAEGIRDLALMARLQGKDIRVFDIRYATSGIPVKITPDYVLFAGGCNEILDTGPLNGPATEFERLTHPKLVFLQCLIHAEICEPVVGPGKGK